MTVEGGPNRPKPRHQGGYEICMLALYQIEQRERTKTIQLCWIMCLGYTLLRLCSHHRLDLKSIRFSQIIITRHDHPVMPHLLLIDRESS
jgi:hypothetical protein